MDWEPLPLRSPTLLNVAWIPKLGWDGHFRNLEEVAMGPITAVLFEDSCGNLINLVQPAS